MAKMEQFEKWSKLSWSNSLGERIAEENAWRAALEWILEIDNELQPNIWDFVDIVDMIKKELGDGNK